MRCRDSLFEVNSQGELLRESTLVNFYVLLCGGHGEHMQTSYVNY